MPFQFLKREDLIEKLTQERQIRQLPGWATWTPGEAEANIRSIVNAQTISNQADAVAALKKLEDITVNMARMMVIMRNLIIKQQA